MITIEALGFADILTQLDPVDTEVLWCGHDGLFDRAAKEIRRLRETLSEVRDLIEGYVDADHNGISFVPNDAMRAKMLIDEVLADAQARYGSAS